jgi:2,4-dienoyl-CoA reductase-like NADH-dependent reductase (Old Yellow Enzyme family)
MHLLRRGSQVSGRKLALVMAGLALGLAKLEAPMSNDPLLQPYQLKHLTLRNRIMTTSHEPAYPEDGMPKDRYRLYHLERAKAGVAMVMTAGSAAVSKDSPPVFNNVLAYKDEVVPWMKRIADDCHEAGAAVMIQLTHLGRRTALSRRSSRIGTSNG